MAMLPSWDEVIHEDWDFSKALPWEHLQGAIKPELLMQHHQQSIDEASAMNPKT